MSYTTALLEPPTRAKRLKAARPHVASRNPSDLRRSAEALLRDMGFVFHLTRTVKQTILATDCQVRPN